MHYFIFFLVPQLQESKMATCSVRYKPPHLSEKARSSEASRFSIKKIWHA